MQKLLTSALVSWQPSVSNYFKTCTSQQEIQATDITWVWNAGSPHCGSQLSLPARLLILFTATTKLKVKSRLLPQLPKLLMAAEVCWQSSLYYSRIEECACWNLNPCRLPAIFFLRGKKNPKQNCTSGKWILEEKVWWATKNNGTLSIIPLCMSS